MKKRDRKDDSSHKLVYSTDPPARKLCIQCYREIEQCVCKKGLLIGPIKPVVRIEKKGRGGKSVTIIERLPAHETFLKELCAKLKRTLGTGGTWYLKDGAGVIEVQGERREEVWKFMEKEG